MPIYAYKCGSCGFAKDVLQKISDAPLTECPSCLGATFSKQVTAAGFQLKGSGWYVTDFRGGGSSAAPGADGKSSEAAGGKADDGGEAKPSGTPSAKTDVPSVSGRPAAEPAVGKSAPAIAAGKGSDS